MKNFKPTLAATIEREEQIQLPAFVSPKLDGIRALGSATGLLSRSLKPIPNAHIQAAYLEAIKSHPELIGLDGELIIGPTPNQIGYYLDDSGQLQSGLVGDYNTNQSAIMSTKKVPFSIYWMVFDYYARQLTDCLDYQTAQPYKVRYHELRSRLNRDLICFSTGHRFSFPPTPNYPQETIATFNIQLVPQTFAKNLLEVSQLETKYLSLGYEGLMLRHPESPYKCGRSTLRQAYLCKLKRFEDSEATIVGFIEQLQNNNPATIGELGQTKRSAHQSNKVGKNTLGILICEHPHFGQIRVGTGLGLDDKLRKHIWENQSAYEGRTIKFKYQPVGTQDKPRLPIFLGFRSPEDL